MTFLSRNARLAILAAATLPLMMEPALAKKAKPVPAKQSELTTDIATCKTMPVDKRDQCISRSRPVPGSTLAGAAKVPSNNPGLIEKAKAAAVKAVAAAKLAIGKDGRTNIADCAKVEPQMRDKCISLSRPVKGQSLAAKAPTKAVPAVKAPAAPTQAAALTSLPRSKDGTTALKDCANVTPTLRDKCISLSRPVTAADLGKRAN